MSLFPPCSENTSLLNNQFRSQLNIACKKLNNLYKSFENAQWVKSDGTHLKQLSHTSQLENIQYSLLTKIDENGPLTELNISNDWYRKANAFFLDECNWEVMNGQCQDIQIQQTLLVLKKIWLLHGEFSHYTASGLIEAHINLKAIKNELLQTMTLLHKDKSFLKTVEGRKLREYLLNCLKLVDQKFNTIVESMYARWELFLFTDFGQHDLTSKLILDLKNIGITTGLDNIRPLWQREDANPNTFANFLLCIEYINENCQGQIESDIINIRKKRLARLISINKNEKLSIRLCGNTPYFLPESLAASIPKSPRHPKWLFRGYNYRYSFFKNDTISKYLFDMTRFQYCDINAADYWDKIQDNNQFIFDQILKIKADMRFGFRAFFNSKTNWFLSQWQTLLRKQRTLLIEKQIVYLKKLCDTPPVQHLFKEPGFAEELFQKYKTILKEAELMLTSEDLEDNFKADLIATVSRFRLMLDTESTYKARIKYLNALCSEFLDILQSRNFLDAAEFISKIAALNDDDKTYFLKLSHQIQIQATELIKQVLDLEFEEVTSQPNFEKVIFYLKTAKILNVEERIEQSMDNFLDKFRLHALRLYWLYHDGENKQPPNFEKIFSLLSEPILTKTKKYYQLALLLNGIKENNPPQIFTKDEDYAALCYPNHNLKRKILQIKDSQDQIDENLHTILITQDNLSNTIQKSLDDVDNEINILRINTDNKLNDLIRLFKIKSNLKTSDILLNDLDLEKSSFCL